MKTTVGALLCGIVAGGVSCIAGAAAAGNPATAAAGPVNAGFAPAPPTQAWALGRPRAFDRGFPAMPLPAQPGGGLATVIPVPFRDVRADLPRMPARGGPVTAQAALDPRNPATTLSLAHRGPLVPSWVAPVRDVRATAPQMPGGLSLSMALSAVPRRGSAPLPPMSPQDGRATAMSATSSDGVATAYLPAVRSGLSATQPISMPDGLAMVVSTSAQGGMATIQATTMAEDSVAKALAVTADAGATTAFTQASAGVAVNGLQGTVRFDYESRSQQMNRLVLANPRLLERDPRGAPVLRGEITLLLPERAALPEAFFSRGFTALREVDVLGQHLVVLRTPEGLSLPAALELAKQLAPQAEADFNHLMTGSGQVGLAQKVSAQAGESRAEPGPREPIRVGLIDEPVGPAPDLAGVRIEASNCSAAPATGHGTAVAAVLARAIREGGGKPVLYAADLRCGHGAVDAIATALQTMASERVPVVNLSAVGPHNRVLAAVVAKFLARGHVLVAAVGNDGPAASPLYPAAYPGVVAVTGVDRQGRVLMEAGTGEHVTFAAPGIVDVDGADGTSRTWRGTSFAAPAVTAALALRLAEPDVREAAAVVTSLAARAVDAGGAGRDRVYGFGVVGQPPASIAGLR